MKRSHKWFGLLVVSAACVGCGGPKDPDATAGTNPSGRPVATAATASIPPNEIVEMFADCVRRGDRDAMFKLITPAARQDIQKSGQQLDPPGSPEASFKIGSIKYLDNDKDAAYVESLWIEPAEVAGQPPKETEVLWAVQLELEGWRISGLAIDQGNDQPPFLLDFENLAESLTEKPTQDRVASEAAAPGFQASGTQTAGQSSTGFAAPPGNELSQTSPQAQGTLQPPPANQPPTQQGFAVPQIASPPNSQSGNSQLR
jgi:hypothetical protein